MSKITFQKLIIYTTYMAEKLTDNEIRDITKMLEAGKPLDDKYRYLL